jgi:hypothetical protein
MKVTPVTPPSTSVRLNLSAEDREEEAIVSQYSEGSACCIIGPSKSACWMGVIN